MTWIGFRNLTLKPWIVGICLSCKRRITLSETSASLKNKVNWSDLSSTQKPRQWIWRHSHFGCFHTLGETALDNGVRKAILSTKNTQHFPAARCFSFSRLISHCDILFIEKQNKVELGAIRLTSSEQTFVLSVSQKQGSLLWEAPAYSTRKCSAQPKKANS